jgi:hypothetical protein
MTHEELVALYRPADSIPPMPALDGSARIAWGAVRHAYGPATDIPAVLRALVSSDTDHRDQAMDSLFHSIWHQGNIFSATATTIPFLFNLLEAEGPHHKSAVAFLLATIAGGQPSFAHCEDDPAAADEWRAILSNVGRSLDVEMADGRRYAAEIRQLLAGRLDLLVPYLRDAEPAVREVVAAAVGHFPESAARFLPDLQAALGAEGDESVREALQELVERLTAD